MLHYTIYTPMQPVLLLDRFNDSSGNCTCGWVQEDQQRQKVRWLQVKCCRFLYCKMNGSAVAPYYHTCLSYEMADIRGWTIKFANSPPCACRGSTGQRPQYGLMTLTYQRFTAVLLLIFGSLFLSGIYYCLHVFWCVAARMSELELEQRTNIKQPNHQEGR